MRTKRNAVLSVLVMALVIAILFISCDDNMNSDTGDGSSEPGGGSPEPGDGSPEPGDGSSEPGDGSSEPGDGSSEPGDGPASKTPITGAFTYSSISITRGQTDSQSPQWSDTPSEQTVTYAIDPSLPEGMSISDTTGTIEVGATAGVQHTGTTYTITATGTGDYEGSLQSTVSIAVIRDGFVFVEGGTFTMGLSSDDPNRLGNESPQHDVTVSSFLISKYEVTQALYESVMGSNPSYFNTDGTNKPVEQVTWYEAVEFCNALSEQDGMEQVYVITRNSFDDITEVTQDRRKNGYRLPTEAEWEYAARGGQDTGGYLYSGSNTVGDVAWHTDNSDGTTHEVGTKDVNELDLYDMTGNVFEWCWDWFGSYGSDSQTDPAGPETGTDRILRGGSVLSFSSRLLPVSSRFMEPPSRDRSDYGFRLVRRSID